jgi:hypothetical protein
VIDFCCASCLLNNKKNFNLLLSYKDNEYNTCVSIIPNLNDSILNKEEDFYFRSLYFDKLKERVKERLVNLDNNECVFNSVDSFLSYILLKENKSKNRIFKRIIIINTIKNEYIYNPKIIFLLKKMNFQIDILNLREERENYFYFLSEFTNGVYYKINNINDIEQCLNVY